MPMWPRPRSRIPGTTASAVLTGPQSITSTAEVKWDRSRDANGPTWMMPATQTSTSIGPSSRSVRSTSASTADASPTSQRPVATVQPAARS